MKHWIKKDAANIKEHSDRWYVYNDEGNPVAVYDDRNRASDLKKEIERVNWLKRTRDWIWEKRKKKESGLSMSAATEEKPLFINMLPEDPTEAGLDRPGEYPPNYQFKGDVKPKQMKSPSKEVLEKYDMPGFDYSDTAGYHGSGKQSDDYDGRFDSKMPSGLPDAPGEWYMTASLKTVADKRIGPYYTAPRDIKPLDPVRFEGEEGIETHIEEHTPYPKISGGPVEDLLDILKTTVSQQGRPLYSNELQEILKQSKKNLKTWNCS
jgi:hypothetical protein